MREVMMMMMMMMMMIMVMMSKMMMMMFKSFWIPAVSAINAIESNSHEEKVKK